jgi:uncharacterized protein
MEIDLHQLAQGQTRLRFDQEAPSIGLKPEDVAVSGPMAIDLVLDRLGDEIWIRGRLHLTSIQQCSRCLTDYPESLELDFEVFCAKVQYPNVVSSGAVEDEDGGVHFHDGRILSIDQEIREAVILGLPMKPLCKESCAGLCPRCGEDRNLGPCRCVATAAG